MKNNKFIYCLFSLFVLSACMKEDTLFTEAKYTCNVVITNTHPAATKFQNFIDDRVSTGVPGMAMLIESPEGIWQGASGYADIPSNVFMKSCNIMRVGSITKTFTATLILLLQEEGALDINDKISDYLDEDIIKKLRNADQARIKNLLNHTSGLADYSDQIGYSFAQFNDLKRPWTTLDELAFIYEEDPQFEVGTKWNYCNTNFLLLGLIAEKAGGKTVADLYQEKIFNPLGLSATSFSNDGINPDQIVRGYWDDEGGLQVRDATDVSFAHHSTAGGICSNIDDLHQFMKAITTPGLLLSQSSIDLMQSGNGMPRLTSTENKDKVQFKDAALGLLLLETPAGPALGHGGRIRGYSSFMLYFPDAQTYFVYIMNGSNGDIKAIEQQIYKNEMIDLLFE